MTQVALRKSVGHQAHHWHRARLNKLLRGRRIHRGVRSVGEHGHWTTVKINATDGGLGCCRSNRNRACRLATYIEARHGFHQGSTVERFGEYRCSVRLVNIGGFHHRVQRSKGSGHRGFVRGKQHAILGCVARSIIHVEGTLRSVR